MLSFFGIFSVWLIIVCAASAVSSYLNVGEKEVVVLEWRMWIPRILHPANPAHVIARKGEQGIEARHFVTGVHWVAFWRLFAKPHRFPFVELEDNEVLTITAQDGEARTPGQVFGRHLDSVCFSHGEMFFTERGQKGPQMWLIGPGGSWAYNHFLFKGTRLKRRDFLPKEMADPINPEKKNLVPTFGVVTTLVGLEIEEENGGRLLGRRVLNHNNFQDIRRFLEGPDDPPNPSTMGQRGPQREIVEAAAFLHPLFVEVKELPATVIPQGFVGVRISNVGEKPEPENFLEPTDSRLASREKVEILKEESADGKQGIRPDSYKPGVRQVSPFVERIALVDTTPIKVCFHENALRSLHPEAKRSPMRRVRTQDGFEVTLQIEVVIRIKPEFAPMLVAHAGDIGQSIREFVAPVSERVAREVSARENSAAFIAEQGRIGSLIAGSTTEGLRKELDQHYVTLVGVNIVEIEFESEAIKARVKATTDIATLEARREVEKLRKDIQRLAGEADAEAEARVIERTAEAEANAMWTKGSARRQNLDDMVKPGFVKDIAGAILADPDAFADILGRGRKEKEKNKKKEEE